MNDGPVLRTPGVVIEIARKLQDAGFAAWCVGGAVRDAILGLAHLDWDLATSATPAQVQRLFRRTVPVGIQFGTVGVLDRNGRLHEVTTFRRDVKTDGRHAVVEFGASLDDDLARRDFTINSIAWDPIAKVLYDPFDGQGDLAKGVVRAVGVARDRMREDRLRALRAIRFASRFNFEIEPDTWASICESAPYMTRLSPERVKQEIDKTLEQVDCASSAFRRWRESGAFASVVPQLASVDDGTLQAIDRLPRQANPARPLRRMLRLSALLSALDGKTAVTALKSLRASNHEISVVGRIVENWFQHGARIAAILREDRLPSDPELRRIARDTGRLGVNAFLRLGAAHWIGDPDVSSAHVHSLFRRFMQISLRDPIEVADLAVDGDDLRRAGVAAGPAIGEALRKLLDVVLDDPSMNRRERLLEVLATSEVKPEDGHTEWQSKARK